MTTVKVLKSFYDLVADCNREVGESFDVSDERAAHIDAALPGYVEIKKKAAPRKTKAATKE